MIMNDFAFLAPVRLLLLVVPLALAVAYLTMQARRRRYALRFTTLDLLDEVAPDRPGWRRHLPAIVLLLGTIVAALAVAKPAVAKENREPQRIVVLAIDTSLSMQATDVSPSRVDAAKASAAEFLKSVPDGVAVGVVGFDSRARQLIAPTTNLDAVQRTIERAKLGQGTAIGEAVFLALDSIDTAATQLETAGGGAEEGGAPAGTIVLLSDGETTDGRPNDEAAAAAKERGIAVNTIAFGTNDGFVEDPMTGEKVNVPVNEQALAQVARTTGGQSLRAETAAELNTIYENLGRSVAVEVQRQEVTDWFAALALLLLVVAATGSLVWFGRLP
jgi:Ca-activated chloride channel family protein